ncbi:hypothetical protein ZIOFF_065053 [Zingiber officinale]|uniref:Uncharacterized protein n=2 Tax=Zingiber officinale TaxID=94328 RepID=A0A8J5EWP3_ZINOF|nr:hypothetical protein ZIOFF_065053 [Zingiber officinale]
MDSGLTLQRATLLLLSASLPIAFLSFNAHTILLQCGQDAEIATAAQVFVVAASPDILLLSLLHPLRVFLRSQNITLLVTYCSSFCVALHGPLTYLLVIRLRLGIAGVAIAMVWTNLSLLVCLLLFLLLSGAWRDTCPDGGGGFLSGECFRGWPALLRLAMSSCVSVCLEWWWWASDWIPAQSHPDSGRDHASGGQMAGAGRVAGTRRGTLRLLHSFTSLISEEQGHVTPQHIRRAQAYAIRQVPHKSMEEDDQRERRPVLDLNLSISTGSRPPPSQEPTRAAALENAHAARLREMARRELQLAEQDLARARLIWERASEEMEKAERMKGIAAGMNSACLEITCRNCHRRFRP